jgi:hypothetical protein
VRRGNPDNPLTSMALVFRFCYMSSVRSTSDGRGPVTRKRVPDREEQGKPRQDAPRGRCHLLESGFWPLWMTPLPRHSSHKSQVTSLRVASGSTPIGIGDRPLTGSGDQIPYRPGGWVLHQPPWSFGFDSQTRGTRENRRTLC